MFKASVAFASVLAVSSLAVAQHMSAPLNATDMKWEAAPNVFPRGAQLAVVSGDPFKDGLYVVRMKLPSGYKIPAHNHPTSEYVTVISGELHLGMGDKLDKSKGEAVKAGGFFSAEPRMRHYAWTTGETVIEISGMGPFDIQYVDKNDDPMKGMKGKSRAQ